MKKVLVENLKEGLVFSAPVFIDGDNLFAPAGTEIRKKDIARLISWGVEYVETDGEPLLTHQKVDMALNLGPAVKPDAETAPKATAKAKHGIMSIPDVYENNETYRTYIELIERLNETCEKIALEAAVENGFVDSITKRLMQAIKEQRHSFIVYILGGEVKDHDMAKNMLNTAILSALIALELKLQNRKITQIVTGALLHDVGMLRMPPEIVGKKGGLSATELQLIQSHTLFGYRIVAQELRYHEEVGLVVLQHHERWDGEGYPGRIAGTDIDIGARIVSVADAFEAMVSQKPYRNSMMGYQAMKNLLSDNLRRFDPDVIKAFIQTMGIYPIGSIILLNNGAFARVEEVMPIAPLRPRIKILVDESGKVFEQDEGDVIDLLAEKSLYIARAVDHKEVAGKYAK